MKKSALSIFLALISSIALADGLRVMSYNIRLLTGRDGANSWECRRAATPEMLRDINPVVFGVQEAFRQQLDYILEQCPRYREIGVGRDDGADGGEHMSVFYNTDSLKLVRWGNYWLSQTPDRPGKGWDAAYPRTATWALFEVISSGRKFYFVNTHLDHKGFKARKKGLHLIYDKIRRMNRERYPMVLTGDFNVTPDDDGLKVINRLMLPARFTARDADSAGSFNGWGKYGASSGAPTLNGAPSEGLLPIDYIYYKGFSDCLTFKVVMHQYAGVKFISDHYPIYSDLEF